VYGLGQLYWLAQLTFKWTNGSWVLALTPWLLATALYALYFGLAGWLINRCWRLSLPWLIPVVWTGVEVFRSYIPVFAFPWGLIASPLWHAPNLMSPAHFLTIYGVSALVVLINTGIALWIQKRDLLASARMVAFAMVATALAFGLLQVPHASKLTNASAGQTGVDLAFGDPKTADLSINFNVERLEQQAIHEKSQILILPEGLIRTGDDIPPRVPFSMTQDLPIVFGAQRGKKTVYQSAFGFDGRWSVADKTRLVIFGEFVPGRNWIPFLDSFHLPTGDISAGSKVEALRVANIRVGPLICFEALFPDLAYRQALNGSQILAVMSIDDWFMGTTAPDQLRAGAIWRAVETGLPLVRAASTGYTFVADRNGTILGETPIGDANVVTRRVGVTQMTPPWWLPIFPLLSFATCCFLVALPVLRIGVVRQRHNLATEIQTSASISAHDESK
jgi:apolipoprotein N-acyltransferase